MQSTAETWLPIPGYEGYYEVSDNGGVRSVDRSVPSKRGCGAMNIKGRALTPVLHQAKGNKLPRLRVSLRKEGKSTNHLVSRLVLLAFVGPPPEGSECCHRDDNSMNDALSNLYWGTRSENMNDRVRNGKHPAAEKTQCVHGHEYTPENTARRADGRRRCRACAAERKSRSRVTMDVATFNALIQGA